MDLFITETYLPDKRVTKLARDVASSADSYVPRLLLQLKGILDSCSSDVDSLTSIKNQLWKYELYPVLQTALKQDFNKIVDGWNTAAKLCISLVSCCSSWRPPEKEEIEHFRDKFLPATVIVLLSVANRLQKKYMKVPLVLEDVRKQLLSNFSNVFDALMRLCTGYDHLLKTALESAFYLQMLLTDDVQTGVRTMNFLQFANRHKFGLYSLLDVKIGNQILDELTFKLSIGTSPETAGAATRCLIIMCDSHPPLVEYLCSRYKGLRLLLLSRQLGGGKVPTSDLQRLLLLLDMGNFQRAELEKVAKSARIIQAWWRSYRTRRQISQADKAIARLQRTFRYRKRLEEKQRQEEKMRSDLEHMLLVQRRYNMRQLHRQQLYAIEILPASQVEKHLANEQARAAIKIQAYWKGYRLRRGLVSRREAYCRLKAAIVIQRLVRKWLDKVRAKKEEVVSWLRPPGLDEARRAVLQSKIQDWRQTHTKDSLSRHQLEQLHAKAQDLLKGHVISVKASRKRQQHREALLARLEVDANLLLNSPRLCDIGDGVDNLLRSFVCYSTPVAARAKLDHAEELRLLEQPWWRKLGDEYQDSMNSDIDNDLENWKIF